MSRRAAHTVADAEPPCHEHDPAAARDKHTSAAGEELPIRDLLGSASVFAAVLKTLVEEALERVDGTGALSLGQLRFVSLLGAAGPVTLGELAQRLDMTDAAASRQVDHLTRRGLIHRRSGKRDRRTVQISLARGGEAVIAASWTRRAAPSNAERRSAPPSWTPATTALPGCGCLPWCCSAG